MGWFSEWWSNLTLVGQIMACAAIPMTVVMFLQLILMIIGVGFGSETDGDVDDGGIDTTAETTPPDSLWNTQPRQSPHAAAKSSSQAMRPNTPL